MCWRGNVVGSWQSPSLKSAPAKVKYGHVFGILRIWKSVLIVMSIKIMRLLSGRDWENIIIGAHSDRGRARPAASLLLTQQKQLVFMLRNTNTQTMKLSFTHSHSNAILQVELSVSCFAQSSATLNRTSDWSVCAEYCAALPGGACGSGGCTGCCTPYGTRDKGPW